VIAAVVAGVLLLAIQPPSSPSGEVLENARLRLRIHPPAGWRVVNDGALGGEIELSKGQQEGPRILVNVFPFVLEDPSDLAKAQRELSAVLTGRFPDLRVVQEKQLTHQGNPAIQVIATLPLEENFYHVVQRCIFAGRRVYIVTCASFEGSFVTDLPTYYAFLDRVEILGPASAFSGGQSPGQHLVSPYLAGLGALVLLPAALLLRRISVARLERLGRWPLPPSTT
jgi:hypothetical protein